MTRLLLVFIQYYIQICRFPGKIGFKTLGVTWFALLWCTVVLEYSTVDKKDRNICLQVQLLVQTLLRCCKNPPLLPVSLQPWATRCLYETRGLFRTTSTTVNVVEHLDRSLGNATWNLRHTSRPISSLGWRKPTSFGFLSSTSAHYRGEGV